MDNAPRIDAVYVPSEDIVAREIEGEIIIVPLTAGIGDLEDELFTLNKTGRAIWTRMDGKNTLSKIVQLLADEFEGSKTEIEENVLGFAKELYKRKIIIEG